MKIKAGGRKVSRWRTRTTVGSRSIRDRIAEKLKEGKQKQIKQKEGAGRTMNRMREEQQKAGAGESVGEGNMPSIFPSRPHTPHAKTGMLGGEPQAALLPGAPSLPSVPSVLRAG